MERLGWPPEDFQCSENSGIPAAKRKPEALRIEDAQYVGGHPGLKSAGDMLLTLVDRETEAVCTARWKIQDEEVARRIQATLMNCKGLTLAQAGLQEIPEDGQLDGLQPPTNP